MSKRRFYCLALFLGLAGQFWIVYSWFRFEKQEEAFNTCIFRRVTSVPCPSCGTVHSIVAILHGNFIQALRENPLGYAVLLLVVIAPLWIIADLLTSREGFYRYYLGAERVLQRKRIFIPLILIIMAFWAVKLFILYC